MIKDLNNLSPSEFADYRQKVVRAENLAMHLHGKDGISTVAPKRRARIRSIIERCERIKADDKRNRQTARVKKMMAGL
jgi:hypothetical protein